MSDFSIPGVNNRYFSQEQIDEIMEAEAAPIRRLEREIESDKADKRSWQEIGRRLSELQGATRQLFGVDSPFRSRSAQSSNESVLYATASRSAEEERTDVIVKQTATPDRFASNPLPDDLEVGEGTYTFTIGEREHSLRYRGGNLDNFVTSINRRMGDDIRARVVQDTPSTRRLVVESRHEGAENTLGFADKALNLALDTGIIAESRSDERSIALPGGQSEITAGPDEAIEVPVSPAASTDENLRISMELRITRRPEDSRDLPESPTGPQLPEGESVSLRDATVRDSGPEVDLPNMEPPPPPPIREDPEVLFFRSASSEQAAPPPPESGEYETIDLSLQEVISGDLQAIEVRNNNTLKDVSLRNLRIYNPDARGDYAPVNALATAQDAVINVDGIDFTRPSNKIDDIIPGTTLEARRASPEPIEVAVGPDRETVKETIIEFVGYYNQLFTEALILSRGSEDIVDEVSYFDSQEREEAMERLGRLRGDSTMNQIIRSLQTATSSAYPSDDENGYNLLSQIGISTNAARGRGSYDPSQMRGYLQINEDQLDEALETNFTAVRRLFGNDSDGDGAIDTGVAHELDRLTRPYIQTGGIIATRTDTIDSRIERADDQIATYSERLEKSEQDLKRDFARMEGAIQQMESNAQRFENMNPNQQN